MVINLAKSGLALETANAQVLPCFRHSSVPIGGLGTKEIQLQPEIVMLCPQDSVLSD